MGGEMMSEDRVARLVIEMINAFIKEKEEEGKTPTLELMKEELESYI